MYLKPEGTPFGPDLSVWAILRSIHEDLETGGVHFSGGEVVGTKPNFIGRKKESEKRAWNARYALHNKYPWDVGLGKLVPLTIRRLKSFPWDALVYGMQKYLRYAV